MAVTLVCLEMAPKGNNSDHTFSLRREVPCTADASAHAQNAVSFTELSWFVLHITAS